MRRSGGSGGETSTGCCQLPHRCGRLDWPLRLGVRIVRRMDDAIPITEGLAIPRAELEFRATRSGGPGGQHVNTSSTRIELTWNVASSPSLSDAQRARIQEKLANRIDDR